MAGRHKEQFAFNTKRITDIPEARKFSQGVIDELDYDPDNIMTKSTAEDHQWAEARFKYPGDWHRAVQKMIQMRLIPEYETMADFYRDALYHRLYWAARHTHDAELSERTRMILLKHDLHADIQREKDAEDLFQTVRQRVIKSAEDGMNIDHAALGRWRRYAEGFDPKYRERILSYIDKFYKEDEDTHSGDPLEGLDVGGEWD